MTLQSFTRLSAAALLLSAGLAGAASAASVQITITNNSGDNGLYFTPFLNVFHDGSYTPFNNGTTASAGLEALAEVGDTSAEQAFALTQGTGTQAFTLTDPAGVGSPEVGGPPVFDPGNSASFELTLDPFENQFLTILSMAIPSNDTFISTTLQLFNDAGEFIATNSILGAGSLYDAGTEINQSFGQAFNPQDGNGPGFLGEDENGVVHETTAGELATLFGQPIPPFAGGGPNTSTAIDLNNLVSVEVSEVPLPAGLPLLLAGLGAFGWMKRRKDQAAA
ncbi:MAG: spondin domain-containing protein [Paracoccaceae bacterium]